MTHVHENNTQFKCYLTILTYVEKVNINCDAGWWSFNSIFVFCDHEIFVTHVVFGIVSRQKLEFVVKFWCKLYKALVVAI